MLCERCRQREANVRFTEVINGVKTEHMLCMQCAMDMDLGSVGIFGGENPIGKIISGILGANMETAKKVESLNQISCPTCGMAYSEFVNDSRFGCPDCYNVFDILINDNIKQLQGNTRHIGKKPRFGWKTDSEPAERIDTTEGELALLESKLAEAIAEEEYEQAAKLRDEIKRIKGGLADA
ncbi:MAG: UvrB/UvrC motif-containing protein [Lachnospiraceae bacterium]|nr:UvrB/UvrC motif-containing protein [Lachnospiraceae bacterium]